MAFAEEIGVLQSSRRAVIAQLRFNRASDLEQNVKVLRTNSDCLETAALLNRSAELFAREQHEALNSILLSSIKLTRKIYQLRAAHERETMRVRNRQASEISRLTSELAKELEVTPMRSVPQANALLRHAVYQAGISNYDLAEEFKRTAKQVRVNAAKDEQHMLHEHYVVLQEKLVARHREYEAMMQTKLEYEIREVHRTFAVRMNVCRRRIETAALKHRVQISPAEIDQLLAPYRLDDDEAPQRPQPPPHPTVPVSRRLFDPAEWTLPPSKSRSPRRASARPVKKKTS
jgi:hypothetical protein